MTERDLFIAALQLDPAERPALFDRECPDDPALRQRIEILLAAHEAAGSAFGSQEGTIDREVAAAADPAGTVIGGRYKLLEAIGEGGMGTVWVAEQTQPVRRKVALKLIKAGMDSKSVLARFEAERQALAVMDHPNIAKVLDGGLTEAGRPYFVMEYVKGVPITEYCEAARLSVPQRLQLFVQVCQAVQHAHQKGIIHRDLKPSNILVAPYDDRPVPKVIDFGLAKAMHLSLTERTLHTAHETVLGTPLYMSPEQAQLNNLDVDTRSDLYSLGVLLYELLTGTTPLEKQRFKEAAWDEVRRIIREEEPPRPSMRLSTSQALPSLATGRQTEPARLTKLVRGDLDWIVMKALEKDRTRRYETANGFAMDIERYLAGEPVLAAPPSACYRLRKFAGKHRASLTTAAAITLLVLAGAAFTTWQAVRARRAETAARAAAQEALQEKKIAEDEKQTAQSVRDFLQNKLLGQADSRTQADALLRSGGLSAAAKENPTIRELLDRAAKELAPGKIDLNFPNQPLVQAEILQTVGLTYRGVGEYQRAIGFLERSAALYRQHVGLENPNTLTGLDNLALAYHDSGRLDVAVPLFEETLKLIKAKLGPEHPDTLASMNNLAMAYWAAGKLDLAVPLGEETLKLKQAKLGRDHRSTLVSMNNLATAYQDSGRLDLALPLLQETLQLEKAKLGPEHPDTLASMNNLARAYWTAGKLDLAVPLSEETLRLRKEKLGPNHPDTLTSMNNLAEAYRTAGRLDLAMPLDEETLKLKKAKFGVEHLQTLISMNNLALAYQDAGKLDLAVPLFEEAYRGGKKYYELCGMGTRLLDAYSHAGKTEQAVSLAKDLLAEARMQLPKDSPQLAGQLEQIALSLLQAKAFTEAEPLLRECLTFREKTQPDEWTTFNTKSMLGGAMLGQKKYADAEPLLLAGYEGMKQREAKFPPEGKVRLTDAVERLVQLYEALEKKDETAKWRKELEARKEVQVQRKLDKPRPVASSGT